MVSGDPGITQLPSKRRKIISKTEWDPSSSSSLSKFLASIGDDILLEILVRLSNCRFAMQCGLVCKRWYSLICNTKYIERFIHVHHHQQKYQDCSLLSYTLLFRRQGGPWGSKNVFCFDSQLDELVFDEIRLLCETSSFGYINFLPDGMFILASSNDLLLVTDRLRNIYVLNPITRQLLQLPDPPTPDSGYGFVCQPKSCNAHLGCNINFRYRYRVVLTYGVNVAYIFCSETGKWRSLAVSFSGKVPKNLRWQPIVSNGVIYWLDGRVKTHGIVAFDLFNNTEDARIICPFIDLPLGVSDSRFADKLCCGSCLGRLRFSSLRKRSVGYFGLKVWELNYHGNGLTSWNLVCKSPLKRENIEKMFVLAFHPNNSDVIFVLCDNQFCRYEIGKRKFIEEVRERPNNMIIKTPIPDISTFSLVYPPCASIYSKLNLYSSLLFISLLVDLLFFQFIITIIC